MHSSYFLWERSRLGPVVAEPACTLTGLPRDKMAAIFRCIFVNEKFCILIKISLQFVPRGPIDII